MSPFPGAAVSRPRLPTARLTTLLTLTLLALPALLPGLLALLLTVLGLVTLLPHPVLERLEAAHQITRLVERLRHRIALGVTDRICRGAEMLPEIFDVAGDLLFKSLGRFQRPGFG